jgi:hypothetical protein
VKKEGQKKTKKRKKKWVREKNDEHAMAFFSRYLIEDFWRHMLLQVQSLPIHRRKPFERNESQIGECVPSSEPIAFKLIRYVSQFSIFENASGRRGGEDARDRSLSSFFFCFASLSPYREEGSRGCGSTPSSHRPMTDGSTNRAWLGPEKGCGS